MERRYNFSKKRTQCPLCNSHDGFARFISGGDIIGDGFGHCFSCGETIFPDKNEKQPFIYESNIEKMPYSVPKDEFSALKGSFSDTLRKKLVDVLPKSLKVSMKYEVVSIGTATGFPLIDYKGDVRSIKIMEYAENMHRIKEGGKSAIRWYHSGRIKENQYFDSCFFGENLIKNNDYEQIAIVESEKTAIVGASVLKNVLFLACGSKSNIKQMVYKGLKDKDVILYPDADGWQAWDEFLKAAKVKNWKISNVCKELGDKEDICDVLLGENSKIWAQKLEKELFSLFVNTKENRNEAKKLKYYEILNTKFSIEEFYNLLENYGIETTPYNVVYQDKTFSLKIESKESSSDNIYSIFKRNGKINEFFTLIESLHVPKFENTTDFSFNFTDEDFKKYIESESKCFFDNIVFDRIQRRYIRDGEPNFDLKGHVLQCLENLYSSSLNEQKRKLTKDKTDFVNNFVADFENKPIKSIATEVVLPQTYVEIFERGQRILAQKNIGLTDFAFWHKVFSGLWTISEIDTKSMILFCAATIRFKFMDDSRFGKLIQVTGDSNVGKDSFIPSLFLGEYIENSEYVHQGALFTKGFLSISTEKCKSLIYNIISDDIMASNECGELSKITDLNIVCNNKYGGIVKIRNTWNKIVSNNDARITMNKRTDKNALARRFCIVSLKYKKGCTIKDYIDYFSKNTENFYDIYAAFFTFCYNFAQTEHVFTLQKEISLQNIERVKNIYYMNNDDEIICENFVEWLTLYDDNAGAQSIEENEGRVFTEYKGVKGYFFKCDWTKFSPKLQKSKYYIINDVLKNNFEGLEIQMPKSMYGKTIRLNWVPFASISDYRKRKENFFYNVNEQIEIKDKEPINILEIWNEK